VILVEATLLIFAGSSLPRTALGFMLDNAWFYLLQSLRLVRPRQLVVAVMAFNFLGDGLRDQYDPRRRLEMELCDAHSEEGRLRTLRDDVPLFALALRSW
jgi:hypothetical protein